MINEERRIIQTEAIEALKQNNYNGIVILPTGTGKSFVLVEVLRHLYKEGSRILYTCDSQLLRDSGFSDELRKWGAEEYIDKIEKQCYASAYKFKDEEFDVLLADEGDYALTPEYIKLFYNNKFKHIIFVSATLEAKKRILAKKIAPVVYEKKLKEIENREVVNKSQLFMVPYMLNQSENTKYLAYNKRFRHLLNLPESESVKKQLQFLTLQRMHFLAGLESSAYICKKLVNQLHEEENTKLLIFCNSTEQADKVSPYSYHGKNVKEDNLVRFNNGEINTIAVCGKVDRGINLTGVNSIIMEYITSSETKAVQKIGRGKRLNVDEILNVYVLVPYFKSEYGKHLPTIVYRKFEQACKNLGFSEVKSYIVK